MTERKPLSSRGLAPVVTIILSGVVAAMQVGKVPVVLPQLEQTFGLRLDAAGTFMAIFSICGAVGGVPAGLLVARLGDRRLLLLGAGDPDDRDSRRGADRSLRDVGRARDCRRPGFPADFRSGACPDPADRSSRDAQTRAGDVELLHASRDRTGPRGDASRWARPSL